jgi:ribonuclease HI
MPDIGESQARNVAEEWTDWANNTWTDGSWLEDGRVGCSVVWKEPSGEWKGEATHPGTCREVYDAELHAIERAIRRFITRNQEHQSYTIFSNSQSAIERCKNDKPGPGQAMARTIIDGSLRQAMNRCKVMLRWVPAYKGIEGNEIADCWAKVVAKGEEGELRRVEREMSLAHVKRRTSEERQVKSKRWIQEKLKGTSHCNSEPDQTNDLQSLVYKR